MAGTTVRVSPKTRDALRELARELSEPMQSILAQAVEAYRRNWILEAHNAAYAALREDPEAWADVLAERAAIGM